MFKQIILPILACAVFIVGVGIFTQKYKGGKIDIFSAKPQVTTSPANTKTIKVGSKELTVEVASSEAEREKGLSDRASLDENRGMLFVFEKMDVVPSFWMKGMLIPLDLIWINDGKIIKIDKSVQPEKDVADNKLKIYNPGGLTDYVLEVNAGYSDKNEVKVGNTVELPL